MKTTFFSFFLLELKRFRTWKYLIVIFAFAATAILATHLGVLQYRELESNKAKFQEIEELKVGNFTNWNQYGGYGIRLYFMPSPLNVYFHNSSPFPDLTCRIDVGEEQNIYGLFKGKKVFAEKPLKLMDFPGIILIMGAFLSIFYGYEAFLYTEFIKYLASMVGYKRTYWYIIISRIILLTLFFTLMVFISLKWAYFHGVKTIELGYIGIYLGIMIITQIFFFNLGVLSYISKKRLIRRVILVFFWVICVFVIPTFFDKIVELRSSDIFNYYDSELQKIKILMNFEKNAIKKEIVLRKEKFIALNDLTTEIKKMKVLDLKKVDTWITERIKNTAQYSEKIYLEEIMALVVDWSKKPDIKFEPIELVKVLSKKWISLANEFALNQADHFLKIEFKSIQDIENKMLSGMENNTGFYHLLFSSFPSSFYLSLNTELSGRGYGNMMAFYRYAKWFKDEFMNFYINNKYVLYRPISFIEMLNQIGIKNVNVYQSSSGFPKHFFLGVAVSLGWLFITFYLSFLGYKRTIFSILTKELDKLKKLDLDLEKGKANVALTSWKICLSSYLYSTLSGKCKKKVGKIVYDKKNLVGENNQANFIYLCHAELLPTDIKITDFFFFLARIVGIPKNQCIHLLSELNRDHLRYEFQSKRYKWLKLYRSKLMGDLVESDRAHLFLSITLMKKKRSDVYVFHDYAKGMTAEFVKKLREQFDTLKTDGAAVVYITNDVFMGQRLGDAISFIADESDLMTVTF